MANPVISTLVDRANSGQSLFATRTPPELRYAGFVTCRAGETFHHPMHNDPDVTEIALVLAGRELLTIDGKEYTASRGDLIVFNQGIWHEERSCADEPFSIVYTNLADLEIVGLPPGFLIPRDEPPIVALGDAAFAVEERFRDVERAAAVKGAEADRLADHLMGALLAELVRHLYHRNASEGHKRQESEMVGAVRRVVHSRYGEALTLEHLSEAAFTNRFHLCRVFKQQTGTSPIDYLIKYRMEVAKQYLATTNLKVAVIAERVGYQSETHFHTLFRKLVGVTPAIYRRYRAGPIPS